MRVDLLARLGGLRRRRRCRAPGAAGRRPARGGEAGDHAGLRAAGHRADDDRVEEDAELALLLGDLVRPAREAEPAERVVGGAGRDRVRRAAARRTISASACSQLSLKPMPKPGLHQAHVGADEPAEQDVADLVVDARRASRPSSPARARTSARACAATAATWRVWLDCTPPIETSVSQPCASASATRYSSLRVLLPPKASPLLQSSRFAQTAAPPRCAVSRSSGCTGDGPNSSGWRGKSASAMGSPSSRRSAYAGGPGCRARSVGRAQRRLVQQRREGLPGLPRDLGGALGVAGLAALDEPVVQRHGRAAGQRARTAAARPGAAAA